MSHPADLQKQVSEAVARIADDSVDSALLLRAVSAVWASKWTTRATFAASSLRVAHANITMSVLVQPLIDARFAFVAHTADPRPAPSVPGQNGSEGGVQKEARMYIEAVSNLGESLVSNLPGSAFACVSLQLCLFLCVFF